MKYIFEGLSPKEINTVLEQTIMNALHCQYGIHPDPTICQRVQQELQAMRDADMVLFTAAAYELTQWLNQHRYPYYENSTAACSFISFLLGITKPNPLAPHLHCPNCHRIVWDSEHKDGFDIPQTLCPHEDTPMEADGHNMPWQIFWGCPGLSSPLFIIMVPKRVEKKIASWFNNHWLWRFVAKETVTYIPFHRNNGLRLCIQCILSDKDRVIHEIDSACKHQIMRDKNSLWEENRYPTPSSFADFLSVHCLCHCIDGLNDYATALLRICEHRVSDLITCREDVYLFFRDKGLSEPAACLATCYAHKGRELPPEVLTIDIQSAKDKWMLSAISNTKYYSSKSVVLEWLFYRFTTHEDCAE